jgi:hypothetical protein
LRLGFCAKPSWSCYLQSEISANVHDRDTRIVVAFFLKRSKLGLVGLDLRGEQGDE